MIFILNHQNLIFISYIPCQSFFPCRSARPNSWLLDSSGSRCLQLSLATGPFQRHQGLRSCVYTGVVRCLCSTGITSGPSGFLLGRLRHCQSKQLLDRWTGPLGCVATESLTFMPWSWRLDVDRFTSCCCSDATSWPRLLGDQEI